jgi:hypothetical protein
MPLEARKPRPGQVTRLAEGLSTDTHSTEWRREAQRVISVLAHTGHPFHVDDVRMLVGEPASHKQLGSAFASAARQKLIRVVGAAIMDGRLVRVWRGMT